jgi:hypothetical protein
VDLIQQLSSSTVVLRRSDPIQLVWMVKEVGKLECDRQDHISSVPRPAASGGRPGNGGGVAHPCSSRATSFTSRARRLGPKYDSRSRKYRRRGAGCRLPTNAPPGASYERRRYVGDGTGSMHIRIDPSSISSDNWMVIKFADDRPLDFVPQ